MRILTPRSLPSRLEDLPDLFLLRDESRINTREEERQEDLRFRRGMQDRLNGAEQSRAKKTGF